MPGGPQGGSGKPGEDEAEGTGGEGDQAGSGGEPLPTWNEGNGKGGDGTDGKSGTGEWDTSNQIPEVPVDITKGAGGVPGQGNEDGKSGAAGELDAVLKDIDGGIMAERDEIKARAGQVPGDGSEQRTGNAGSGRAGDSPTGSEVATAGDANSMPGMPDGIGTVSKAPRAPHKGAGIPNDIADARDEDIIARQLREAAMQEQDPVIREKLWEDYRRYKGR